MKLALLIATGLLIQFTNHTNLSSKIYEPSFDVLHSDTIDSNTVGIVILPTLENYEGVENPIYQDEISQTHTRYSLLYNNRFKCWVLTLKNTIVYTSALLDTGRNSKTLEMENPGIVQFSSIHEQVHVERNIKAVYKIIDYTTDLLTGEGNKTFTGTADKVMTAIDHIYEVQRANDRYIYTNKKRAELDKIYDPLIEKAAGKNSKIAKLRAERNSKLKKFEDEYDIETEEKIKTLGNSLLDIVVNSTKSLNQHLGNGGVNQEALSKMKKGSNEYNIQAGITKMTWQGVEIKPSRHKE